MVSAPALNQSGRGEHTCQDMTRSVPKSNRVQDHWRAHQPKLFLDASSLVALLAAKHMDQMAHSQGSIM